MVGEILPSQPNRIFLYSNIIFIIFVVLIGIIFKFSKKKGSAGCLRGKEAKGVDCVNPAQPA